MRPELQKKIDSAIKLLRSASEAYGGKPIEVAYSGGKDSDVILQLTREAGIPYRAIYKNNTIDPPGTIKHVQEMGVEMVRPKHTFFEMIAKKGFPSRFARFCCSELKEYPIEPKMILGIRREESAKRAANYVEPTLCRYYRGFKGCVEQILPILEWTLEDVKDFVLDRGIKLAPYYYREDGTIDFKRRLGCMGCPLQSDRGLGDFKAHPKLVRAWIRAGKKWWDAERETPLKAKTWASDIYELFAARTFHDTIADMVLNKEALSKTDYKKVLEDYFKIKL